MAISASGSVGPRGDHVDMWEAIILAAVTARLVHATSEMARSSQLDQEAQWRPVIVPALRSIDEAHGHYITLHLENAGRGPALSLYVELANGARGRSAKSHNSVVSPGRREGVVCKLQPAAPIQWGHVLNAQVSYYDIAGRWYRTELMLVREEQADGSRPLRVAPNRKVSRTDRRAYGEASAGPGLARGGYRQPIRLRRAPKPR